MRVKRKRGKAVRTPPPPDSGIVNTSANPPVNIVNTSANPPVPAHDSWAFAGTLSQMQPELDRALQHAQEHARQMLTGAPTLAEPPKPIPVEQRAEAITSTKVVNISADDNGDLVFIGMYGRPYGPDSWAECIYHDHIAPAEDCTCGFYAKDGTRQPDSRFLAHVELSGTVFEHDPGEWRARRQRIMRVTVGRSCHHCTREAVTVGGGSGVDWAPADAERFFLVAACLRHAPLRISLADLSSRLGTEFAWAES